MGKGIEQQIEDNNKYTKAEFTKILKSLANNSKPIGTEQTEQFNSFLDELTSNQEYPDEMEIFTTDIGWHKIKDYR